MFAWIKKQTTKVVNAVKKAATWVVENKKGILLGAAALLMPFAFGDSFLQYREEKAWEKKRKAAKVIA